MLPDRVSNPGPLTYESGALPIALGGQAAQVKKLKLILPYCCVSRVISWPPINLVYIQINACKFKTKST